MTELLDGPTRGLAGVPLAIQPLNKKDFSTDQEVRWCPGCGDYSVLAAMQQILPELGIARENTVVVSGIGCSSRFPYYLNSYGLHSIHGRAPAIATGLAMTRPDLAVFVATGDGDALSIGGNHLIHALRRNVNLTILLFNNRIYGLTKGQFSPTSELGKVTKSSPLGSVDSPMNPISLALGAEASFVARSIDSDRAHLTATLRAAAEHRGSALVEIYQNCPIFNDGTFDDLTGPDAENTVIRLEAGQPITFAGGTKGIVRNPDGSLDIAEVADVGIEQIVVHDPSAEDPTFSFALSRLSEAGRVGSTPVGIFRQVARPTFDDAAREQIELASGQAAEIGKPWERQAWMSQDDLARALAGEDTWAIN